MLIGNTYYYRLQSTGLITRDADCNMDTPDHTADSSKSGYAPMGEGKPT
jgi:hypothetical protein